jgi:hypothetical protein
MKTKCEDPLFLDYHFELVNRLKEHVASDENESFLAHFNLHSRYNHFAQCFEKKLTEEGIVFNIDVKQSTNDGNKVSMLFEIPTTNWK